MDASRARGRAPDATDTTPMTYAALNRSRNVTRIEARGSGQGLWQAKNAERSVQSGTAEGGSGTAYKDRGCRSSEGRRLFQQAGASAR